MTFFVLFLSCARCVDRFILLSLSPSRDICLPHMPLIAPPPPSRVVSLVPPRVPRCNEKGLCGEADPCPQRDARQGCDPQQGELGLAGAGWGNRKGRVQSFFLFLGITNHRPLRSLPTCQVKFFLICRCFRRRRRHLGFVSSARCCWCFCLPKLEGAVCVFRARGYEETAWLFLPLLSARYRQPAFVLCDGCVCSCPICLKGF